MTTPELAKYLRAAALSLDTATSPNEELQIASTAGHCVVDYLETNEHRIVSAVSDRRPQRVPAHPGDQESLPESERIQ